MFNDIDFDKLDSARSEYALLKPGECSYVITDFLSQPEKIDFETGATYSTIKITMRATDENGESSLVNTFISSKQKALWMLRGFLMSCGLYNAKKEGWLDYQYLVGRSGKFINAHNDYLNKEGKQVTGNSVKTFIPNEHQFTKEELEPKRQSSLQPSQFVDVPEKIDDDLPF